VSAGVFFGETVSKPFQAFLLVTVLAGLAYSAGLSGPLIFDDFYNLAPIGDWLKGVRDWQWVLLSNGSGTFGRPVSIGSLMLNALWFNGDIAALKAGNILLHLANGLLVYALFSGLTQCNVIDSTGRIARWLPVIGASIWLLHPLLVSTVLYVIQRMAILSASFVLLGLLAYLHGRLAINNGNTSKALLLFALVPIATVLASLSKENGVLAPSLCATIELCLFSPRRSSSRHWASKSLITAGLVLPAIAAILLIVLNHPRVMDGYSNRPFSLPERLLTQPRVLWDYIGAYLAPNGPNLGLYHDDYLISRGLLEPYTTLLALLGWFVAAAVAWRLRHRVAGVTLGLAIFIVGHSLESSIFPLLMFFEHRNYLPSVGLALALVSAFAWIADATWAKLNHPLPVFAAASIALSGALGVATWARAGVWNSQEALLQQGLEHHPKSRWMRLDFIRFELSRNPPNYSAARTHIDALEAFHDDQSRRAGAVWGLMWACLQDETPRAIDKKIAFQGNPATIEADLLSVYEAWGTLVRSKTCPGMSKIEAANALVQLANNSTLPRQDKHLRRIHYKAAELYIAGDLPAKARKQALAAYSGQAEDAPIAGLLIVLDIASKDFASAQARLRHLERQTPKYNYQITEMIELLSTQLDEAKTHDELGTPAGLE